MFNQSTLDNLDELIQFIARDQLHDQVVLQIPPGRFLQTVKQLSQSSGSKEKPLNGMRQLVKESNFRVLVTLPTKLSPFDSADEAQQLLSAYHAAIPQVQWISSKDFLSLLLSSESIESAELLIVSTSLEPIIFQLLNSERIKLPSRILLSTGPIDPVIFVTFPQTPIFQIDLPTHSVEIRYLPEIVGLNNPRLSSQTAALVASLHESSISGNFLVCISTPLDAKTMFKSLNQMQLEDAAIVPVFKEITDWNLLTQPVTKAVATDELQPPLRKIYITTSQWIELIPIDDLSVVIDTLIEPQLIQSPTGGTRWILGYESLILAEQRSGRLGATQPGLGYRLGRVNQLAVSTVPIQIQPQEIIELVTAGFDPLSVLTPTSQSNEISALINQMVDLGLFERNDSKLAVTEAGKFVSAFPLSLRYATVLWRWYRYDYPFFPGLAIVAMLDTVASGTTFVALPEKRPDEDRTASIVDLELAEQQFYQNFGGYSDVATLLNLLAALFDGIGGPDGTSSDIFTWCQKYRVNFSKIQEVLALIHQGRKVCTDLNITCSTGPFNAENVLTQLRPILAEVYTDWLMQLEVVASLPRYRDRQGQEYRLEMLTATNNFDVNPPVFLLALLTTEIIEIYPQGGGTQGSIINLSIDVNTKDVVSLLDQSKMGIQSLRVDQSLRLIQSSNTKPVEVEPIQSVGSSSQRQKNPRRTRRRPQVKS